jgi:hypothetical protein
MNKLIHILDANMKNKLIHEEFKNHKFKIGESYDKFLNKLLKKYNQSLKDYLDVQE